MNVVWVMFLISYGGCVGAGPEFKTQDLCEKAAVQVKQASEGMKIGPIQKPVCVRIEK